MNGFHRSLKSLALLLLTVSASGAVDGRLLKIKSSHPRLFADSALIAAVRLKTADLSSFRSTTRRRYHKYTANPLDTARMYRELDSLIDSTKLHTTYYETPALYIALNAYLNNDTLSKAYARQLTALFARRPVKYPLSINPPNDMPPRGRLLALGVLYDWSFQDLSPALKSDSRRCILNLLDFLDSTWSYFKKPNFISGHSRTANTCALIALLAIRQDILSDDTASQTRYFSYLSKVAANWIEGYNPTQSWICQGGGHPMGWAYGSAYTSINPYMAWHYATNESTWVAPWHDAHPYFFLYGLRNDHTDAEISQGGYDQFPYSGDAYYTKYASNAQGDHFLLSAHLFNNRHAKWFYGKFNHYLDYMELLYYHNKTDSGTPPFALPLSRSFQNSGFVLMRDSWDFDKNTLLEFKATPFYSMGHVHKDQNAFTIFYKGPLAMESGGYSCMGEYGSRHFYNYYTRSVAHNTILVYDSSESFGASKYGPNSNDGGQKFMTDPKYLSQIRPGDSLAFDGIQVYENHTDYTLAMGNATRAYSSKKLGEFRRFVLYLRNSSYNHPAIVVCDKVVATQAGFKKSYLLHSRKEPQISGPTAVIVTDDGIDTNNTSALFQETLSPSPATLVKIGGRANNREFYVFDDGGNPGLPHNYNEEADYANPQYARGYREAGEWRVEVSPGQPGLKTNFLHVLSVTDGLAGYSKVQSSYVKSSRFEGAYIRDNDGTHRWLVLFKLDSGLANDTFTVAGIDSAARILVAGLSAGAKYQIARNLTQITVRNSLSGSFTASGQGTVYTRLFNLPASGSENDLGAAPLQISQRGPILAITNCAAADIDLTLYDVSGRIVHTARHRGERGQRLLISWVPGHYTLANGIYTARIKAADQTRLLKLIFLK